MDTRQVMIVGGGAAGLAASIAAARELVPVILFEKGPKTGRKMMISGAGRCNLTNSAPFQTFIEQYFGQGRFLYPAFTTFFRDDLLALLAQTGLQTKEERSGKIFPESDRALDVVESLTYLARQAGVVIHLSEPVTHITLHGSTGHADSCAAPSFPAVPDRQPAYHVTTSQGDYQTSRVLIATGGCSWPQTGSCGDGYRLARSLGHSLTATRPALTGLRIRDTSFLPLQGISHDSAGLKLFCDSKKTGQSEGELIWTHFGLSGPAVLRLSRDLPPPCSNLPDHPDLYAFEAGQPDNEIAASCYIEIDFLPAISEDTLRQKIQESLAQQPRKNLKNVLAECLPLPEPLLRQLMARCEIKIGHKAAETRRAQVNALLTALKGLRLEITGSRGYQDAMVTAGGVQLSEVNPRTMESRLLPGLFFAGEVLDIDGDTGGYNLQAAFSTGWLAGQQAARSLKRKN